MINYRDDDDKTSCLTKLRITCSGPHDFYEDKALWGWGVVRGDPLAIRYMNHFLDDLIILGLIFSFLMGEKKTKNIRNVSLP